MMAAGRADGFSHREAVEAANEDWGGYGGDAWFMPYRRSGFSATFAPRRTLFPFFEFLEPKPTNLPRWL